VILKPTAFVLGAGASHPYIPLGLELVDRACSTLEMENGRERIALRLAGHKDADVVKLKTDLHKSRVSSIDRFLTWHPQLRDVGKAAMAAVLIPFETDKRLTEAPPNEDWYRYLFEEMLGSGLHDFERNRLSIVTFSFDRSFERALYRTLQRSFALDGEQAANACSRVRVIHIHGELGVPAWLQPNAPNARDYKPAPARIDRGERADGLNPDDIQRCAHSIRLFSEDCAESAIKDAHEVFTEAERVCFLGFGYQRENIQKLSCRDWWRSERMYHGTAFGLEAGEAAAAKRRFPDDFQLLDGNCRDFLHKTDYIRDE
jgi:hypothetical protein